jgi:hypothetical protein
LVEQKRRIAFPTTPFSTFNQHPMALSSRIFPALMGIALSFSFASCAGDAGQVTESLQAELSKFSGAVSGGGTTPAAKTPPPPPKPGTVDVSSKGKGTSEPKVDVSKKGSAESKAEEPKVDVSKKGKGGGR